MEIQLVSLYQMELVPYIRLQHMKVKTFLWKLSARRQVVQESKAKGLHFRVVHHHRGSRTQELTLLYLVSEVDWIRNIRHNYSLLETSIFDDSKNSNIVILLVMYDELGPSVFLDLVWEFYSPHTLCLVGRDRLDALLVKLIFSSLCSIVYYFFLILTSL